MRTSLPFASVLLSVVAAVVLSGCVVATRIPGPVLYVDRAPPVAYSEAVLASPGPGYIWVGGYYSWTGRDYYWNRGHWTQPVAAIPPGSRATGTAITEGTIGCQVIGASSPLMPTPPAKKRSTCSSA